MHRVHNLRHLFTFVSSLSHTPFLSSIYVVSFPCELTGETRSAIQEALTFGLSALTLDDQLGCSGWPNELKYPNSDPGSPPVVISQQQYTSSLGKRQTVAVEEVLMSLTK